MVQQGHGGKPPTSIDELLQQAAKVGLAYNTGFYQSAGLLLADGGKVFDANQKCVLDQGNSVVDALTFIKNAKGTPNVIADADGGKLDAAFKDGKVGMIFNGPWATGDYVKALGADKLGIADPITVGQRQVRALPRHQEHLPERQQQGRPDGRWPS